AKITGVREARGIRCPYLWLRQRSGTTPEAKASEGRRRRALPSRAGGKRASEARLPTSRISLCRIVGSALHDVGGGARVAAGCPIRVVCAPPRIHGTPFRSLRVVRHGNPLARRLLRRMHVGGSAARCRGADSPPQLR